MSPIKGLLVDMDGTLVDTASANYEAYAAALSAAGVSISRERFDEAAEGRNWRHFLPGLLAAAGSDADPAAVAAHKQAIYGSFVDRTVLNEPLATLLRSVRALCRTALVTTASSSAVTCILGHHGMRDLFDTIVTGSDVSRHKPDPEAYFLAAERLGLRPEECLIFEDTEIGVASAAAFGARCLRVVFPA